MSDHMSTAEYKALMAKGSKDDGAMSDEDFKATIQEKDKKPRNNEEDELTKQVASYLEVLKTTGKVQVYSHIPNSTFTSSWSVKNRNKSMGVRPGVPDMLIVFNNNILFLELKKEKGGVLSPYQKEWIQSLNKVEEPYLYSSKRFIVAKVACGWLEAKQAIDDMI